ncbi:MAG: hypothetical protein AAF950_16930 [Pseudomonadota bacterium]
MPSDLAAAVTVTRSKCEACQEEFAEFVQTLEGVENGVTERLTHLRDAMHAVRSDIAGHDSDIGASLALFGDGLAGNLEDIVDNADGTDDDLIDRFEEVVEAAKSFDLETSQRLTHLFDRLDEGMQTTGKAILSLEDQIENSLSDRLGAAKERISSKLEELLDTERTQLLEEIEEALAKAIAELSDAAETLGERTRDDVGELWGNLTKRTEERFTEVLRDSVDRIAQQVVQETAQQVVADIGLTQLSAQVTMSLQSQLPTLTAAKYSVDAVKSLLDAL